MSTEKNWTVSLSRYEVTTAKPFDEVLEGLRAGLGHPDFAALQRRLASETSWDAYQATVADAAGSSGLMIFLELDLGSVVAKDPTADAVSAVRIIAGNPVTMASMVRSSPTAGAFAPVTILVYAASDGVHVRYDTLSSAVAAELTNDALGHARSLDEAVLSLLRGAA